ncbi:MAG: oxidoreductase [Planctomycetaceae bacterium]|nr:oxidoreductase [Planctomycetaceae bacterium]
MNSESLHTVLGIVVVAAPFVLFAILGLSSLIGRPPSEGWTAAIIQTAVIGGLLSAVGVLVWMLISGTRHVPLELGNWVIIPEQHFHFTLKFVFDRLSVPMVILSFLLVGTIGAFANVYLHREPGYHRFFLLYSMFLLGMVTTSVAGTIETLFAGWELVGLSSALLVAFFQDRQSPVRNGIRVWSVYRVADAAFLIAALTLHHVTGAGDFDKLMGAGPWPAGEASLSSAQALWIGLLLLVAAAGKSALIPFCGWLPRAMEGPTPSSAVFYGSLSVHLGAFLLLRVSPILQLSPLLCAIVVVWGLSTALFAAVAGRVQSDIKSALAFASLTQVGIIVAEIGLGLRYLALVHIIGHACLRTLQLLRAPTLLHDYHSLENALGGRLKQPTWVEERLPTPVRNWIYRFALERGYLDALLSDYVALPVMNIFRQCDAWEQRLTDLLSGRRHRAGVPATTVSESLDEIL